MNGNLSLDGNLNIGGNLDVGGNINVGGNVNINGTITLIDKVYTTSMDFTEKTIRINKNRNVYIQNLEDEIIICISESNCFNQTKGKQRQRNQLIDELNKKFGIPSGIDPRPIFKNGGIWFKQGWEEIVNL